MESITTKTISPEISDVIKQAFLENMNKEYELVYTDYRDNYDDSGKIIQDCINNRNTEAIENNQWEADSLYESSTIELSNLENKILSTPEYKHLHPYISRWLDREDNWTFIKNTIIDRDISAPIQKMVERSELRSRAILYTNYDCLPHNYDMGNTYCYDEYFKDIIDVLCLNPKKVKETFNKKGINTIGRWPDKRSRNGNEAVSYADLTDEILNQSCYGLLTFMGLLPIKSLYENNFEEYKSIVIPKGNNCGMFNDWNGGGSLMEMELLRDLYVPVRFSGKTEYDRFEMCVDERGCNNGYCIDEVYGLIRSAWGKEFQLIYK
ncbi:hypothetical protein M2451_004061 [Dysgonomonas sp. PFB1-18]|uniref:hypothetical protein n=1 Tax=unclassified Dysgonomonas TaxID=2630389 RepID=UPI002476E607|nr:MULTISPECIES: hypothetical protein [unclassified Dysgonomonas]MDH6310900.1 hypothetical protein [Dysgonomonas sp. PF1-14]MDH6341031.1 hypothetical protein [Dysgonomonas sp. PF1-16]MDH6382714.1 hypothetical protein [Dysgonomonas sp. PFB1-18]MDH6400023.1 hypothetical protein [Dysgonomonas sp. PF1-23]